MASKTKIYLVLEFVTGGELFDKIVCVVVGYLDVSYFTTTYFLLALSFLTCSYPRLLLAI